MVKRLVLVLTLALLAFSGSGYTTKSLLPEDIKSIYVPPVANGIDLSSEISDTERFRVYRPGVEVDVTNAIINRFLFDGTLRVATAETADAVCVAKLVDYRRDPLRYSRGDDVQEYRLSIVIEVTVKRARAYLTSKDTAAKEDPKDILWRENITGDTTFFLAGAQAVSEDEAVNLAVEDAARRVVEKTIELW